jgi:hypothetical protein
MGIETIIEAFEKKNVKSYEMICIYLRLSIYDLSKIL